MALQSSLSGRDMDKFAEDDSGNVTVRFFGIASSNTSATLPDPLSDREYGKFLADDSGDTAISIVGASL